MSTSTIEQRPEQDGPGPTEGHAAVPVGFWLLFVGLIAFGGYYLWAYTPNISGWTQDAALTRPGAHLTDDGAVNIAATIAFTAVAALTAGAIVLGISRRKKAP